jgi:hypothetical protein
MLMHCSATTETSRCPPVGAIQGSPLDLANGAAERWARMTTGRAHNELGQCGAAALWKGELRDRPAAYGRNEPSIRAAARHSHAWQRPS